MSSVYIRGELIEFRNKNKGKLLLFFFANQSNPFNQLANAKNALDRKYQDIVYIAVFGYQAYFFLSVIKEMLGEQQYTEAHTEVSELMNSTDYGYDFFETTLSLIEIAIEMGPLKITEKSYTIPVPLEMNIALSLLLGLPGSPHYAPRQRSREFEIHNMSEDIDQKVARYLINGKTRLLEWLRPVMAIDLHAEVLHRS